ncbi:N-acetyl-S-(2-succino)cysteine monooxygenase [Paraburkholderia unamae]|uniref:LLM class flavin-dependent oxidoreductase n=1 Tax=Paraburkholderia unamae TaxID=219649 RepID=UPI001CACC399|nr:N-acetyl-S-(2-succino)cysteine monooxygenase [Paraburkholderia unamae]
MRKPNDQMKLGVFVRANGHHEGAWRLPEVPLGAELDFAFWREIARTAENAKFDLFFLADVDGIRGYERDLPALSHDPSRSVSQFEPLTLLSALAVVTEHIGLAATASTTFNEPYHIARKFASLDHLSNGRAAWNVVTSAVEATATNFNRDRHAQHDARYRQADEFVDIVKGLWDSYEDDAFTRDKQSGLFFDPDKLHYLNHRGEHFAVKGPLNVARPVQGHPVIVQAGASEPGRTLAAQIADVIFGSSDSLAGAQMFYKDLKERAVRNGRDPDHLLILPGVFTVIGETAAEAKEKNEQLLELVHPEVGLSLLGELMGIDLRGYPVDGPLPEHLPPSNQQKALRERLVETARRENLTIRELYIRQIGSHGLHTIIGSPTDIADELENWFINEGADGFNIMASHHPGGFDDFARLVVPELRRRGLFRAEYDGKTLRDNLGLPRVAHRIPATRAHVA